MKWKGRGALYLFTCEELIYRMVACIAFIFGTSEACDFRQLSEEMIC